MSLPINIDALIHGKAIEWERLEFKKGWNPNDVMQTMCAFANDINNWGGGYIVIGIEEDDGTPILPPKGLEQNQIDRIQGKVLEVAYKITPSYIPIIQPLEYQDKFIIILWCPAGDNRPYTSPNNIGKDAQRHSYIRSGSRTIIAKGDQLRRLNELASRIPFDDRVNNAAQINDFNLSIIQSFLHEVRSNLVNEITHLSIAELCRKLHIAKGSNEDLKPVNVGILFFTKEPEKFLNRCWIELVWHKDDSGGNYVEKYFKGPLHFQIRAVLEFLKNNIIMEMVHKIPGKPEAERYYNYPFEALEEVISNAVYHKSYEDEKPIEIQVWSDKIEVLSFPGPVPPVNQQILREERRIIARDYRNRRIGDFLKELSLTEGRGTGFPTIYKSLERNHSPEPDFRTDEHCTFFLSVIRTKITDIPSDQDKIPIINDLDDVIAFCDQYSYQAVD